MNMKGNFKVAIVILMVLVSWGACLAGESGDAKELTIAGAGPSTKVVELLGKEFCAANPGYSISVPPISIKHSGGMEWVATKGMLFGRTGRPMSEKDKGDFPMLIELPIARIKVAFAVNKNLEISKISREQLKGIYTGSIKNWKEVGGPDRAIMVLGRAKGESVYDVLCKHLPYMSEAQFMKVYDKDPEIIKAAVDVPGAIAFSSKTEFVDNGKLQVLEIEGFNEGLQVALVYDKKNEDAPTVKAMRELVKSRKWEQALGANDFLPL